MYRVNRTCDGAYHSNCFMTYEEAIVFYNRVKGGSSKCELQAPEGIVKRCRKEYQRGIGHVLIEN